MGIRSFLAFELPPDMKTIVTRVSGEMRKSSLEVKWIRVDNIHLTVVFMGNINSEDIGAIGKEIQKVCLRYGPFDVSLHALGCFPNRRKPRVIWLGLDGDLNRMAFFRDHLQDALRPFGIKEEKRRYRPHLTLGRTRKSYRRSSSLEDYIMRYEDLTGPVCSLNELILFKSDLKPSGAVYTKLKSWPLSGME